MGSPEEVPPPVNPVIGDLVPAFDPSLAPPPKVKKSKNKRPSKKTKALAMAWRSAEETALRWYEASDAGLQNFTKSAGVFRRAYAFKLPGRGALCALNSLLEDKLFHRSPVAEVLRGEEGWLYFTGNHSMEGYCGVQPFTEAQLASLCGNLQMLQEDLQRKGITYLLVLIPDKQTFYPEYVPARFGRVGPSRLEQIAQYLQAHTSVAFLDLRERLTAAKAQAQLYYAQDTHWNEMGAFTAVQEIMRRLQPAFPEIRLPASGDYLISDSAVPHRDLARMIGDWRVHPEPNLHFEPVRQRAEKVDGGTWGYDPREVQNWRMAFSQAPRGEIPSAVIAHDSFCAALSPFLSQHIQRAVYSWHLPIPALIEREHPALVLDIRVERFFDAFHEPHK